MIEVDGKESDFQNGMCPTCKKAVPTHRCRFCGATRSKNAVSGNIIWMRNGRVVEAFQDSKTAFQAAAAEHNIPKEKWPAEFK